MKQIDLNLDTEFLKKLVKNIKQYQKELKEEVFKALKETVLQIEKEAKRKCPVDTGRLRNSITPEIESSVEGKVGTNVKYASAVEYGTKPHEIKPKKAKRLVWKDKDSKEFQSAKKVKHPGTKAQPFLEPAYLHGQKEAKKQFEKAFKNLEKIFKDWKG